MSEQRSSGSFFTHRLTIARPDGFGPDTHAAMDRYVLAQFGQRWSGAFARLGRGDYLLRLDEDTTSDAYTLAMTLAMALFGRISTRALILEPLGGEAGAAETTIPLETSEAERLTRTLVDFAQMELGAGRAAGRQADEQAAAAALAEARAEAAEREEAARAERRRQTTAIQALDAASRATRGEVASLRDEIARASARLSDIALDPKTAAPAAPECDAFAAAKTSAIAFAASLKSVTRRVEASTDALDASAARLMEAEARPVAAEQAPIEALTARIEAVAAEQSRVAAALDAARIETPVEHAAQPPFIASEPARSEQALFALAGEIDANRHAALTLVEAVREIASGAGDVADVVDRFEALAEANRDASEQMLDIAFAWQGAMAEEQVEDVDWSAADLIIDAEPAVASARAV